MTSTYSPSLPWHTRVIGRLEHLAPAWFALVMGWSGLSQAWLNGTDFFGDAALGIGLACGIFAALIFVLLCVACVVRLSAHPEAVASDLRHPIRHAFMATFPISIMLLSTLGIALFWNTSRNLDTALTFAWCVGSVLELAATVWVLGRWLQSSDQGGLQWATFTPVFFIPVVGNVLAPIGGVTIGLEAWSTAQFGIGLLLWPVLQTLLIIRMVQVGPLPARLSPTLFITLAPPSVIALSLLKLNAPETAAWAVWGMGLFFLAWVLTQIDIIRTQPFGMPNWAMSFPLAAFSILTLRLSLVAGGGWLELPAIALLAITSLVILGLTLNTWRGLRMGTLLVAEK